MLPKIMTEFSFSNPPLVSTENCATLLTATFSNLLIITLSLSSILQRKGESVENSYSW